MRVPYSFCVGLFWLVLFLSVFFLKITLGLQLQATFVDFCMGLVCFGSFVFLKPIRHFLSSIPKFHLWITILLLFGVLFGHYLDQSRITFPFMSWNMYSSSVKKDQVEFAKYIGVDVNGKRHEINTTMLTSNRIHTVLDHKLYRLWHQQNESDLSIQEIRSDVIEALVSWGEIYNRQTSSMIQSMLIQKCTISTNHEKNYPSQCFDWIKVDLTEEKMYEESI